MVKKALCIILLCLTAPVGIAGAADIVAVVSADLQPYHEAVEGFRRFWLNQPRIQGQKNIDAATRIVVVYSHDSSGRHVRREVMKHSPRLLLAVGSGALAAVRRLTSIPTVFVMVPFSESLITGMDHISGVSMEQDPARQLAAFIKTVPTLQRLGLLYDPRHNESLLRQIRLACAAQGITLVARKAERPQRAPGLLAEMRGKIDGLWIIPDMTVVTPQTIEAMLYFSLQNRVPLFTFSDKHLALGATVAVGFDANAMGEQAGALAQRLLANPGQPPTSEIVAGRIKTIINKTVAAKLGLPVPLPHDSVAPRKFESITRFNRRPDNRHREPARPGKTVTVAQSQAVRLVP